MPPMRAAAWILVLVAGACGGRADGGTTVFTDGGACTRPLAEFCDGACPSFDDSVAEVKAMAGQGRCYKGESGACGSLRYTFYSSGVHGFMAWFAGDTLVAARNFSDVNEFCNNSSYREEFGDPPICDPVPAEMYCRP